MLTASAITAIFVLILISVILGVIRGNACSLRFSALAIIFFGWDCTGWAIATIVAGAIWLIITIIIAANK